MSNWERKAEIRPEHYGALKMGDLVLVEWHHTGGDWEVKTVRELCDLGWGPDEALDYTCDCTLYNVVVSPASGRAEHDALVEWAAERDDNPFLKWLEEG